jgi:hypothetical protein
MVQDRFHSWVGLMRQELNRPGKSRVSGGLGGSHTTPRGTVVPARPPNPSDARMKAAGASLNGPIAPEVRYRGLGTDGS